MSTSPFSGKTYKRIDTGGSADQFAAIDPRSGSAQAGQVDPKFVNPTTGKTGAEFNAETAAKASGVPTPANVNTKTSTPTVNPAAVQAPTATAPGGAPMVDGKTFAQASAGITDRNALGSLAQKYQQAAAQTKASGIPAPSSAGDAMSVVSKTVQPTQVEPSFLGQAMETDNNFDSIFTEFDKWMEPLNQKKTLLEEYQGLSKQLGIEGINEKLLNAEKIINGTEDDIRNEVTAAGGFATDSQVMALANARNKSLVQNYNQLLATRDNAMQQLNTMMNLTMEDRRAAEQEFDRKMNFGFKVAEFKQKAIDNARSQNNALLSTYGPAGVQAMLANNPYDLALFEKSMGMPKGGLAKLASYTPPMSEMDKLDLELKKSQLYNSQLAGNKLKQDLNTSTPTAANSPVALAQAQGDINNINSLIKNSAIRSAVGPTWLSRFVGRGLDTATGARQNYIAGVEQLRSQLNLDTLINAKARGATFGALSDQELRVLSNAGTKIGEWAMKDSSGKVTGYSASEKDFNAELDKIKNFSILDYIIKGGDPSSVGVITAPDGTMWVSNSNGTKTQLQ